MGLAAGEVVQQRSESLRRHDAQVYVYLTGLYGDLRVAVGHDLTNELRLREGVCEVVGVCAGGDDVQIADGLSTAAQRASDLRPLCRRV